MHHDEIYLIDLWRLLLRQWRGFAIALLAVLALAVAYAFLAKPRYEATAWVQVGQVGIAPTGQDPRPEPFQRVLERLQTRAFQDEVVQGTGLAPKSPEAGAYRGSLKAEPSFYAGLIKLSVRAASPEQAKKLVLATVTRLQAVHGSLQQEPLAQARERLDEVQNDLRAATAERDELQRTAAAGKDNAVAAGLLLAGKETEVRELRQSRADLVARLSANYTFATSMPWPVYQPDHPVAPNRVLILGVGLLGGLGLGLFVAVALDARRRARQPMSA